MTTGTTPPAYSPAPAPPALGEVAVLALEHGWALNHQVDAPRGAQLAATRGACRLEVSYTLSYTDGGTPRYSYSGARLYQEHPTHRDDRGRIIPAYHTTHLVRPDQVAEVLSAGA